MRKSRLIPLLLVLLLMFCQPLVCRAQDEDLAALRKKAEDGDPTSQFNLGLKYAEGQGVEKDAVEAARWYRKAAEQNHAPAQSNLGWMYANGQGVEKDFARAYFYYELAAKTDPNAARNRDSLKKKMSLQQIAEAQRLLREFNPRPALEANKPASRGDAADSRPARSGTGFAITEDGFIVTTEQVVRGAGQIRVLTSAGLADATVVRMDAAHEVALLKVNGRFTPLPVAASRSARLGDAVATVGFPSLGLQEFAPKLAKGEIAALTGIQEDPRHFQISALVQRGNSGGALVDERGNVIGVIVAALTSKAATTGAPAENINRAVKSTFLMGFLESLPEVVAMLKEPHTRTRNFEDAVKDLEKATVLVLVD